MRTTAQLGITATAFLALCQIGQAADLPARQAPVFVPPPPVFTWTGLYVGAVAGGAEQRSNLVTTVDPGTHLLIPANTSAVAASGTGPGRRAGILAGGEVGYNYQINALVLGVEADAQYLDSRRTFAGAGLFTTGDVFAIRSTVGNSYLATVRGRVGFAVDRVLVFATGGAAFTDRTLTQSYTDTLAGPTTGALSQRDTNVGYVVGGGLEYALSTNWSVKAEYLYTSFGRIAGNYTITSQTGSTNLLRVSAGGQDLQIGRFGLNYRF